MTVRAIAPERFLTGQKLQRLDSTTLLQFRFAQLTDLLTYNTPLAFKSYGPGQLATVSFRGTSANHTAVLWNGININQPNLGQTDFSTLPVAGFDRLTVQYGSSASAVGSDAVGGSILLGSDPVWQAGLTATLGRQWASFCNHQTQVGLRYATATGRATHSRATLSRATPGQAWQLAGRTLAYGNQYNNAYPYTERRHYFVEPSATAQRGFVQDIYARHRNGNQLSVHAWLSDNDLMVTPQDTVSRERTWTRSARLLGVYEAGPMTARLGWIQDRFDYAKGHVDQPDRTRTDRFVGRVEREWALLPGTTSALTLRIGGEWSHYRTRTDGYGGALITENRQDLYALLRWQTPRWLASANVRQAFVTRFSPPLTPSLGAEYRVVQRTAFALTAKASVGRSYRVPTLNERYWLVLGNPNLRPEDGFNLEGGLAAKWQFTDRLSLTSEATAYRNRVDNWSYWNPAFGYHVENLQLVVARGGELTANLTYRSRNWQVGVRAGYALTRTAQKRAYDPYAQAVVGKQLPYVPLHTGTFNACAAYRQTRLTVQTQATSRRFITADESQFFPGVVLTNVLIESAFRCGPVPVRVQGQVNNVFDALTFSVKGNALPGRNVAINFILQIASNRL